MPLLHRLAIMALVPYPSLNITISPQYEGRMPMSLDVGLAIEEPDLIANTTLVYITDLRELYPTLPYTGTNAVQASDSAGKIPLVPGETDDG